jgi:hypothetical protein
VRIWQVNDTNIPDNDIWRQNNDMFNNLEFNLNKLHIIRIIINPTKKVDRIDKKMILIINIL